MLRTGTAIALAILFWAGQAESFEVFCAPQANCGSWSATDWTQEDSCKLLLEFETASPSDPNNLGDDTCDGAAQSGEDGPTVGDSTYVTQETTDVRPGGTKMLRVESNGVTAKNFVAAANNADLEPATSMSLCAWHKGHALNDTNIVSQYSAGAGGYRIEQSYASDVDTIAWAAAEATAATEVDSSTAFPWDPNAGAGWAHICATWTKVSGGNDVYTLYINGQSDCAGSCGFAEDDDNDSAAVFGFSTGIETVGNAIELFDDLILLDGVALNATQICAMCRRGPRGTESNTAQDTLCNNCTLPAGTIGSPLGGGSFATPVTQ